MSSAFKKVLVIIIVLVVASFAAMISYVYFTKTATIARMEESSETLDSAATDFALGNVDSAIKQSEELLESDPHNIQALLTLAASYAQKGNAVFDQSTYGQKAITICKEVIALAPANSEAYRIMGYAYEIMEKYDDARSNYQIAIDLNSDNAQAYSNMGHTFDLQGDLEKAQSWYQMALEHDGTLDHALLNSARVSMRMGDTISARARVQALLGLSTANYSSKAEGYMILALISMNATTPPDYEAALIAVNQALAYDDGLPQAWVLSALVKYQSIFELESAEAVEAQFDSIEHDIQKAISINKNQSSAYYVGYLLANVRDPENAEVWRKKALAAIPNDITLGVEEKKNMELVLSTEITTVDNGDIE